MTGTKVLNNIEDLRGRTVILLFGKSRAGKSTFINDAYGKTVAKSTGSMESDTDAITYVNEPLVIDQRSVVLVDSIGLDAAGRTEDNRRNMEIFKAMTGRSANKNIIFVTTKWAGKDESARDDQDARFSEWEKVITSQFPGASIVRLGDDVPRKSTKALDKMSEDHRRAELRKYQMNALKVIKDVLLNEATVRPRLQKEIIKGGKDTPIGKIAIGAAVVKHVGKDADRLNGKVQLSVVAMTPVSLAGSIRQNQACGPTKELSKNFRNIYVPV
ncbi:hypothetical protein DL96DRAFT_1551367 [Flagelloscypha sp. PMI_526]|nr:hypothetical protein DL96DRAFT_1551367 [Flagelloscypha sp. PMI_526]